MLVVLVDACIIDLTINECLMLDLVKDAKEYAGHDATVTNTG